MRAYKGNILGGYLERPLLHISILSVVTSDLWLQVQFGDAGSIFFRKSIAFLMFLVWLSLTTANSEDRFLSLTNKDCQNASFMQIVTWSFKHEIYFVNWFSSLILTSAFWEVTYLFNIIFQ